VATRTPAAADEVVRHRCHNRRCVNPDHLQIGSRAANKHDDWEFWTNGIDLGCCERASPRLAKPTP